MKKISFCVLLAGLAFISGIPVSFAQASNASLSVVCNPAIKNYHFGLGARDSSTAGGVSYIQQFLGLSSTGYFGINTFNAVRSFQARYGIPSTGYVGGLTQSKFYSLICGVGAGTNAAILHKLNEAAVAALPVIISSITPTSSAPYSVITIRGSQFSPKGNTITFAGVNYPNQSSPDGTTILFVVPHDSNGTAFQPGITPISVTNANSILSNTVNFTLMSSPACGGTNCASTVLAASSTSTTPSISYLLPSSGPVGTQVTIVGSGFDSSSHVLIDTGAIGSSSYLDNTHITFTVPSSFGALCDPGAFCSNIAFSTAPGSHKIAVKTASGTSNAVNFTVTLGDQGYCGGCNSQAEATTTTPSLSAIATSSSPYISSISPATVFPGTVVYISGSGFLPTGNTIYFGGGKVTAGSTGVYDFSSINNAVLSFTVPASREDNCNPASCTDVFFPPYTADSYPVKVVNANGASNVIPLYLKLGNSGQTTTGEVCTVYASGSESCAQ